MGYSLRGRSRILMILFLSAMLSGYAFTIYKVVVWANMTNTVITTKNGGD